ncbi:MAG: imidazole glycerol phosphate synthase subunit HisF [Elusimicrobiota bacterium]
MNIRIIPRLDIKGPNLVKGIHLEGLRVLGKPEDFAKYYYENGADELIYMDVVASLYQRNSLLDIVKRTSQEIFIPLTVGGGIRTIEDIRKILRAGADKVSLNTAAIARPDFIREAAETFGSSTIVVSIEAIKHAPGKYEAYTDNGREATNIDVFEWAQKVTDLGAGEIFLTSINQEGTGQGFDLELTRKIADMVHIPVIACGGAGNQEHMVQVVKQGHADAVSVASVLHYDFVGKIKPVSGHKEEGNVEYLNSGRNFSKIKGFSIPDIKDYLNKNNIACRILKEKSHV